MEPIKDFEGYFVTEIGEVWSNRKRIPNQPQGLIQLKLVENADGYLVVSLYKNNKRYEGKVHRLVAETFLPNKPQDKYLVRHFDGNPKNNHVTNLRWGTPQENSIDMIRHHHSLRGIKNYASKLFPLDIIWIRLRLDRGETPKSIMSLYKISKAQVSAIRTRRAWKHVV